VKEGALGPEKISVGVEGGRAQEASRKKATDFQRDPWGKRTIESLEIKESLCRSFNLLEGLEAVGKKNGLRGKQKRCD